MGTSILQGATNAPQGLDGSVRSGLKAIAIDDAPQELAYRQPTVSVQVESDAYSNQYVDLEIWSQAIVTDPLDGGDLTCALQIGGLDSEKLPIGSDESAHFVDVLERLRPDVRVQVVRMGEILFRGYPLLHSPSWSGDRQAVTVQCVSEGQELLRTDPRYHIAGRVMLLRPTPGSLEDDLLAGNTATVTALPAVFNAGGKPNRSAARYRSKLAFEIPFKAAAGERFTTHVWTSDDEPGAAYWRFVDAFRAVLVHGVTTGPSAPISVLEFLRDTNDLESSGSGDAFTQRMLERVPSVSVQSMNVEEAIAVLCQAAGLHYHLPFRTAVELGSTPARKASAGPLQWLRVFAEVSDDAEDVNTPDREMVRPAVHDLPRDEPFRLDGSIDARTRIQRSKAVRSNLTIDRRAINAPRYLGGHDEMEVSILLRPGWEPQAFLDHDEDGVPYASRTGTALTDAVKRAFEFWQGEFYRDEYLQNRLPSSKYHPAHALHGAERPNTALPDGDFIPDPETQSTRPAGGKISDVFRLWVFPDDPNLVSAAKLQRTGDNSPWAKRWYGVEHPDARGVLVWNHETYGGGLPKALIADWVARRRPLRATIARKTREQSVRPPIVRIHFGLVDLAGNYVRKLPPPADHSDWVEFVGDVKVDETRAAIRLAEYNLFNALGFREQKDGALGRKGYGLGLAIMHYVLGHFWVQLTGTVRSDYRVDIGSSFGGTSFSRTRGKLIDTGFDRFRIRRRRRSAWGGAAGNSFLQWRPNASLVDALPDEPAYEDRDDIPHLAGVMARDARRMVGDRIAGSIGISYLDRTWRPGDAIRGDSGLGLVFTPYAHVERVVQTVDVGGARTELVIGDLRGNPEQGAGM